MNIFVIWLVMVVAWNFGYPQASPLEDVIVAENISLFNLLLKKYLAENRIRFKLCFYNLLYVLEYVCFFQTIFLL